MAKTRVIIDEKLLDEAMRVRETKTKKQAITTGLKELIRSKNLEALRQELRTFHLTLPSKELQRLRDEQ